MPMYDLDITVLSFPNGKERKDFAKRVAVYEGFPYQSVIESLRLLFPESSMIQIITPI